MRVRLDATRADQLLAAVLLVGLELQVALGSRWGGHAAVAAVAGGLVIASVVVRRRYPAGVGVGAQAVMTSTVDYTHLPAGTGVDRLVLRALRTRGVDVVAVVCRRHRVLRWIELRDLIGGTSSDALTVGPFTFAGIAVMILLRMIVGARERRVRVAERERDMAAREAVIDERARIARELHDAIAHNVSMMVLQAGAERRVLDSDSSSTREVLTTIEHMGRGALTEMRRLVGLLRADHRDPLAPQPGIDDVPTLDRQVRAAGLPIDLRIVGDRRPLSVGIDLSAYRIIQEGLTNTLKHAGRARAAVCIQYGVDLAEHRDHRRRRGRPQRGAQRRTWTRWPARARQLCTAADLEAGRQPSGGFAVRVRLPWQ